jgi:hypothetical protein
MTSQKIRTMIAAALLCSLPCYGQTQLHKPTWTTFVSRSHWSIRYPRHWRTQSCMACPDPHARDVDVVFSPPGTKWKDGFVGVMPLTNYASRSTGDPLQNLADDFAVMNRIKRINSRETLLGGRRALVVQFGRASLSEEEVTFSLIADEPIEIRFQGPPGPRPVSRLPNFPIYSRMLSTFRYRP